VCGEYFVWFVVDLTSWMNGWKDSMCAVFTQLYRICVAIVFFCFDFGLMSWLHTYWFFISINIQKKSIAGKRSRTDDRAVGRPTL
jgi:hypothetical protein